MKDNILLSGQRNGDLVLSWPHCQEPVTLTMHDNDNYYQ